MRRYKLGTLQVNMTRSMYAEALRQYCEKLLDSDISIDSFKYDSDKQGPDDIQVSCTVDISTDNPVFVEIVEMID